MKENLARVQTPLLDFCIYLFIYLFISYTYIFV